MTSLGSVFYYHDIVFYNDVLLAGTTTMNVVLDSEKISEYYLYGLIHTGILQYQFVIFYIEDLMVSSLSNWLLHVWWLHYTIHILYITP